ncbi:MAG: SLC13 family permease, partial [Myxococcales bacterium]|nr:SLC13 family permease [Myxococcales bacterium]
EGDAQDGRNGRHRPRGHRDPPEPRSRRSSVLVLPVTTLSAFINNTPIVAMMLPVVDAVARRARIPAAKLFMPLSFASILGGVCTLIGTSTNVIVAGLLSSASIAGPEGEPLGLSMFTLTTVGLPVAVIGVSYMLVFGRRWLPERQSPAKAAEDTPMREYLAEVRVSLDSPLIGKTIEQAGLRHLPGLFLSRIDRDPEPVLAPWPEEQLRGGDVLVFVGALESVVDLKKIRGLEANVSTGHAAAKARSLRLVEAVVASGSP